MKTFNFGEKLMAKLGYTTKQEIESLYEGLDESSFEEQIISLIYNYIIHILKKN